MSAIRNCGIADEKAERIGSRLDARQLFKECTRPTQVPVATLRDL
jgi:hypothetical protein